MLVASPATAAADTAAAETATADYAATARIVPVQFAAKGVLSSRDAADVCAAAGKRLPTFAEAQRLAIPIGYADIPRTAEARLRFAAWHAERSLCGGASRPHSRTIRAAAPATFARPRAS